MSSLRYRTGSTANSKGSGRGSCRGVKLKELEGMLEIYWKALKCPDENSRTQFFTYIFSGFFVFSLNLLLSN